MEREEKNSVDELVRETITSISAVEFMRASASDIQIIDIRPRQDFQKDGLKNAVNIFLHDIILQAESIDKSRPVYIYCKNGSKSAVAVMILKDMGYEVYHVKGGLIALKEAGIGSEP